MASFNWITIANELTLQRDIQDNAQEFTIDYSIVAQEQEVLKNCEREM
jgi:hypothetical protein